MPTPTYIPLANTTVAVAAASITFSSIPATYRDLVLVVSSRYVVGDGNIQLRLNADSGSNYSTVYMLGNGSSAASGTVSQPWIYGAGQGTAGPYTQIFQLMDYSATDKHKTVLVRGDVSDSATTAWANRWASTSAITSIQIVGQDGTRSFAIGSTFALYGIAS